MGFSFPIKISRHTLHKAAEVKKMCNEMVLHKELMESCSKSPIIALKLIDSFFFMEDESLPLTTIKKIINHQPIKAISAHKIVEIHNIAYLREHFDRFDPLSLKSFKQAHALLMKGLNSERTGWRKNDVVVIQSKHVVHTPPHFIKISPLMNVLIKYINTNRQHSWIIKACVFHYAIQYIHPFSDGNGRMGRLWQHLLLLKASPIFNYVLIGEIIKQNYAGYYRSLDESDTQNDVEVFILFCLKKIMEKLKKLAIKNKIEWSQAVTEQSRALILDEGVFTWKDPKLIAKSLKKSALKSHRRKGTPLQSAMSMLNFYINRAGKQLSKTQKSILENAKDELRKLF